MRVCRGQMNDYQNTPTVDDQLQKARPQFRRVSSLRYSADPCREEVEATRGVQVVIVLMTFTTIIIIIVVIVLSDVLSLLRFCQLDISLYEYFTRIRAIIQLCAPCWKAIIVQTFCFQA